MRRDVGSNSKLPCDIFGFVLLQTEDKASCNRWQKFIPIFPMIKLL